MAYVSLEQPPSAQRWIRATDTGVGELGHGCQGCRRKGSAAPLGLAGALLFDRHRVQHPVGRVIRVETLHFGTDCLEVLEHGLQSVGNRLALVEKRGGCSAGMATGRRLYRVFSWWLCIEVVCPWRTSKSDLKRMIAR